MMDGPSQNPRSRSMDEMKALSRLAKSIATNVDLITESLEAKSLEPPSLHANGPSPDFVPAGDVKMQMLRREIINSARLLADTFSGPRKLLMDLCTLPNHQAWTLQFLYRYNIPALVPLEGSASFADLAIKTGLDESRLTRIIRYLMLSHVFEEPSAGMVAHSAVSRLLATEKMNMDFLGHNTEDMFPACLQQVDSMSKSPHGTTVLDCGMAVALGGGEHSLFEIFNNDQERLTRFSGAMQFINAPGAYPCVEDDLLINFDWPGAGHVKVVDVGGSQGYTSTYILRHVPNVQSIIVQDLPLVIKEAQSREAPKDIADRLTFQVASFFEPQPVKDADIYLFRFIFHDWPYEKAREILKAQIPSMKPGSRLVVNEALQHDADQTNPYAALIARRSDLQMMVALNAKERSVREWQLLVSDAADGEMEFEIANSSVIVFRKR